MKVCPTSVKISVQTSDNFLICEPQACGMFLLPEHHFVVVVLLCFVFPVTNMQEYNLLKELWEYCFFFFLSGSLKGYKLKDTQKAVLIAHCWSNCLAYTRCCVAFRAAGVGESVQMTFSQWWLMVISLLISDASELRKAM